MTATPAPQDLSNQFARTVRLHEKLESSTKEVDHKMRQAISQLRSYRRLKGSVKSSTELDYGLVAELINELEIVLTICD